MVATHRQSSVTQHDTDPRSFDVRVIRSVLDYWNAQARVRSGEEIPLRKIVEGAFGWLPEALAARARALGIEAPRWQGDTVEEHGAAYAALFVLLLGSVADGFPRARYKPAERLGWFGESLTAEDWLNRILSPLPIHARLRYMSGGVQRVEVPLLTTVQRCVAYAVGLVLEDRWGLSGRVRRCPFERPGLHFFLDYRIDRAGIFLPGAQEYCCPAHSNAHRQQRFRDEHKARPAPRRHK